MHNHKGNGGLLRALAPDSSRLTASLVRSDGSWAVGVCVIVLHPHAAPAKRTLVEFLSAQLLAQVT